MKIRWLSDAVDDLIEISDYIANDNPNAARDIAVRIKHSIDSLKEYQSAKPHNKCPKNSQIK